jgi:hypothetical protein
MSDHDSPRRPGIDTSRSYDSTLPPYSVAFYCLVCRSVTYVPSSQDQVIHRHVVTIGQHFDGLSQTRNGMVW